MFFLPIRLALLLKNILACLHKEMYKRQQVKSYYTKKNCIKNKTHVITSKQVWWLCNSKMEFYCTVEMGRLAICALTWMHVKSRMMNEKWNNSLNILNTKDNIINTGTLLTKIRKEWMMFISVVLLKNPKEEIQNKCQNPSVKSS